MSASESVFRKRNNHLLRAGQKPKLGISVEEPPKNSAGASLWTGRGLLTIVSPKESLFLNLKGEISIARQSEEGRTGSLRDCLSKTQDGTDQIGSNHASGLVVKIVPQGSFTRLVDTIFIQHETKFLVGRVLRQSVPGTFQKPNSSCPTVEYILWRDTPINVWHASTKELFGVGKPTNSGASGLNPGKQPSQSRKSSITIKDRNHSSAMRSTSTSSSKSWSGVQTGATCGKAGSGAESFVIISEELACDLLKRMVLEAVKQMEPPPMLSPGVDLPLSRAVSASRLDKFATPTRTVSFNSKEQHKQNTSGSVMTKTTRNSESFSAHTIDYSLQEFQKVLKVNFGQVWLGPEANQIPASDMQKAQVVSDLQVLPPIQIDGSRFRVADPTEIAVASPSQSEPSSDALHIACPLKPPEAAGTAECTILETPVAGNIVIDRNIMAHGNIKLEIPEQHDFCQDCEAHKPILDSDKESFQQDSSSEIISPDFSKLQATEKVSLSMGQRVPETPTAGVNSMNPSPSTLSEKLKAIFSRPAQPGPASPPPKQQDFTIPLEIATGDYPQLAASKQGASFLFTQASPGSSGLPYPSIPEASCESSHPSPLLPQPWSTLTWTGPPLSQSPLRAGIPRGAPLSQLFKYARLMRFTEQSVVVLQENSPDRVLGTVPLHSVGTIQVPSLQTLWHFLHKSGVASLKARALCLSRAEPEQMYFGLKQMCELQNDKNEGPN